MTKSRLTCALLALCALSVSVPSGGVEAQTPAPGASGTVGAGVNAPAAADPSLVELKKRVQAYWQARVKKDYRGEWELLEPRARARISADEYGRGRTVQYLAVQVEDAERSGSFARVAVRLLVRLIAPPPARIAPRTESTVLQDHWVRIGGVWYRSFEADAGVRPPWPVASE